MMGKETFSTCFLPPCLTPCLNVHPSPPLLLTAGKQLPAIKDLNGVLRLIRACTR